MASATTTEDSDDEWLREAELLQKANINVQRLDEKSLRLHKAIADSLLTATNRPWSICTGRGVGRHLVATCALPRGAVVFQECPLVVGESSTTGLSYRSLHGEMAACAIELLLLPPDDSAARLLQEPDIPRDSRAARSLDKSAEQMLSAMRKRGLRRADGSLVTFDDNSLDDIRWALGVAMVNSHGATAPDRGILGLLASMMEHSCEPNCIISIGNAEDGSVLTLTTKRDVVPGEALTISYVPLGRSVSERRGLLSSQHGFLCECRRCTVEFAVEALKGDEV